MDLTVGGPAQPEPRSTEREPVVLFGVGQMATLARYYLTHDSSFEVAAFTVDAEYRQVDAVAGVPVVPFEEVEDAYPPERYRMFVPIMYSRLNHLRAEKYDEAKAKGYRLISYISSRAVTWPGLVHGDNTMILEGSIVQPFAEIGNDVIVTCGAIVGHDSVVEDHCFLGPGANVLGYVRVGSYSFLGANSTIRDGLSVAPGTIVGAGVTIRRDTLPNEVYVGDPAEPSAKSSEQLQPWLTWSR
jgi:sugar O-acyltransferase (sialic acid O-acetyltransferase NeuD family)